MTAPKRAGTFVWVAGLLGAERQLWHGDFKGNEGTRGRVLAEHPLTEADMAKSLDQLATEYPAPSLEETL